MKLDAVLEKTQVLIGMTSVMYALLESKDTASINGKRAVPDSTVGGALEKIESIKAHQKEAKGDPEWWAWEGQRAYWTMISYILEAADIVGRDNLPDIELPNLQDKVIMDAYYYQEEYGKAILEKAKESVK